MKYFIAAVVLASLSSNVSAWGDDEEGMSFMKRESIVSNVERQARWGGLSLKQAEDVGREVRRELIREEMSSSSWSTPSYNKNIKSPTTIDWRSADWR